MPVGGVRVLKFKVTLRQVKDLMFFLEAQKTIEDSADGEVLPTQNPVRCYPDHSPGEALPRITHLASVIAVSCPARATRP